MLATVLRLHVHHHQVVCNALLGVALVFLEVTSAKLGFHIHPARKTVFLEHFLATREERHSQLIEMTMTHAMLPRGEHCMLRCHSSSTLEVRMSTTSPISTIPKHLTGGLDIRVGILHGTFQRQAIGV